MLLRNWYQIYSIALLIASVIAPHVQADSPKNLAPSASDRVIAIDILLLPDTTMVKKAEAANKRLRSNYPEGYTLGTEQIAHISLIHRYVHEKDLPAIEEAISKVVAAEKPLNWKLNATGIDSSMWDGVAITGIAVERTPDLSRLQSEIEKAVEPLAAKGGTKAAFNTTRELPKIEPAIVDYVENFVPKSSGENYKPHVTIGVARNTFVTRMKAEPFKKFSFKPAGVAIYQLGGFGTAQKELWKWNPTHSK